MCWSEFEVPHLKDKSVPEQLSVFRVPEQEVQQTLHHPGPVGFPGVHSRRQHHGLLGPALPLAKTPGRYGHQVHGVSGEAVAQHPQLTVGCDGRVGGNTPKVALQVWIGVGVTVGHVAGVWVVRELESPGERVQGDGVTVVVLCILQGDKRQCFF